MDPNGGIYELPPEDERKGLVKNIQDVLNEDQARFEGYLRAKAEKSPGQIESEQKVAWEKRLTELQERADARSAEGRK